MLLVMFATEKVAQARVSVGRPFVYLDEPRFCVSHSAFRRKQGIFLAHSDMDSNVTPEGAFMTIGIHRELIPEDNPLKHHCNFSPSGLSHRRHPRS